ncbi:MAG: bifunctional glutamate N-acetyltransferase/amino-acid acetyltransferase ArgJ [Pseudomonadota bacterium]
MAVNLPPPDPGQLHPVPGIELGVAKAGVRKPDRKDLLVMRLAPGAAVAGVFTQNRFCAAPVILAKRHLRNPVRALIVNTGNANAGTGKEGIDRALSVCASLSRTLGCKPEQILPFSTGVIMEQLPVEKLAAGISSLQDASWRDAAEAIMTTDTVPKAVSRKARLSGGEAVVTGIAKGSGMIRPGMATMLAFVATDAKIAKARLNRMVKGIAGQTFNCVTVDGDTSTNDSFILISTGSGPEIRRQEDLEKIQEAILGVSSLLAQALARDGEGATKFVTVRVERGRSAGECRKVAYAIAHSPLVKTAFFASDPNLGRILAAIGNAGVTLDVSKVDLFLDKVLVVRSGSRNPSYVENEAIEVMKKPEFTVRVVLNRGRAAATVWTCDLSFDYVKINAEYRT